MRYFTAPLLFLATCNASANVLQYFTGISYANPAELFKVKKNEFLIGGTNFYTDAVYKGSALNFNTSLYDQGRSESKTISLLPYGRIATRVNEKVVFGVDVTQPFHSNLSWGRNNVARYAATETYMTDVDISPRVSINITPKFNVGGGLNFNFLKNNETNWALPISQTDYAILENRTSGFGFGFNAGLYYAINDTNFFGASYFSSIKQETRGKSLLAGDVNNNLEFDFRMPATTVFNYVHMFSKAWLTSIQVFRSEWYANQYAIFKHTAARPPVPEDFMFPMMFSDSWAYAAALRHQVNDKTGLTLIGVFDDGPEKDNLRPINFPSDKQYFIALSADHKVTKTASIELLYGFGLERTTINKTVNYNGQTMPFTTGKININANVIDLKLKIQA